MSGASLGGGGGGLAEKLEHSTVVDLLQIAVYVYFGWVAYSNLGYTREGVFRVSTNPTVIAVQLAGLLIVVNILELLHDKVSGSGGYH